MKDTPRTAKPAPPLITQPSVCPMQSSSWLSRLSFHWVRPVLGMGLGCPGVEAQTQVGSSGKPASDVLTLPPAPAAETAARCYADVDAAWQHELATHGNDGASFARALAKSIAKPSVLLWFGLAGETAMRMTTAQLLSMLAAWLLDPGDAAYGWAVAAGLAAVSFGFMLAHHHCFLLGYRLGLRLRTAVTSMIIRKAMALRLDVARPSAPYAVNLMANDVDRFYNAAQFWQYVYMSFVEAGIVLYLMHMHVGNAAFAALVPILVLVPTSMAVNRVFSKLRGKASARTDARVGMLSQVLSGIRVWKMNGWEARFAKLIMRLREAERKVQAAVTRLQAVNEANFAVGPLLLTACVVTTHLSTHGRFMALPALTAVLSLAGSLQIIFFRFFSLSIESIVDAKISAERVQRFLQLPEALPRQARSQQAHAGELPAHILHIDDVSAAWHAEEGEFDQPSQPRASHTVLHHVQWTVPAGPGLHGIVGVVGCGKTSLASLVLGELLPSSGTVSTCCDHTVLAPQTPWLLSAPIWWNITGGLRPSSPAQILHVLRVTSMVEDVQRFPQQLATVIGEAGVSLSGGQQARLSLARAVFMALHAPDPAQRAAGVDPTWPDSETLAIVRDAQSQLQAAQQWSLEKLASMAQPKAAGRTLVVLDDVLAAVDARTGKQLVSECILGTLVTGGATVLLATHQLQWLEQASSVLLMHEGRSLACGTMEQVIAAAKSAPDEAGHALQLLLSEEGGTEQADTSIDAMESSTVDTGAHDADAQHDDPADQDGVGEYGALVQSEAHAGDVAVTSATYIAYWKAGGGAGRLTCLAALLIVGQCLVLAVSAFLVAWTETPEDNSRLYTAVYWGLLVAASIIALARAAYFFDTCLHAASTLHDAATFNVLRAPLAFFTANPSGRIMARLSKDVGQLCYMMLPAYFDFVNIGLWAIAAVAAAGVGNPPVLIALIPAAIIFHSLRKHFLTTAKYLQQHEGVSRAPVFTTFTEMVQGLDSLRACHLQASAWERFKDLLDENTTWMFWFIATTRWLGFYLDAVCVSFLGIAALGAVALTLVSPGTLDPQWVALSLTLLSQLLGSFQWCTRQSALVSSLHVAVNRLLHYARRVPVEAVELTDEAQRSAAAVDTSAAALQAGGMVPRAAALAACATVLEPPAQPERQASDASPALLSQAWPEHGELVLRNVWLRYRADLPWVLRGVNACIPSGARVGVCGRSGAGKSTLLAALLRLCEYNDAPVPGAGPMDGVWLAGAHTQAVSLTRLRRSVAVIPQSPVLYQGTVRTNLDPLDEHTDEECWRALRLAQLERVIQARGGLSCPVGEGGAKFSTGQRQLLCLARATLRKCSLVLLDEPTAAIDTGTDVFVQQAVRMAFPAATVVVVAHRLDTVIRSDLVIAMYDGAVAECGSPSELLARDPVAPRAGTAPEGGQPGYFAYLVEQTGPTVSATLRAAAREGPSDAGEVVLST